MTRRKDDLRIRPGRIGDSGRNTRRPTRFVNEVMRAARKAGHTGFRFGGSRRGSTFGRGRFASTAKHLPNASRRVVVKARVVRNRGSRYRSVPMTKHVAYLQRDGVSRDGKDASLFSRECVQERIGQPRLKPPRPVLRTGAHPQ